MVADDAVVQAGDPLFSIDSRPFELALRQAEANLANTMQGIDASAASLVAAQASVTQARTNLDTVRADTNRVLRLKQRELISATEADGARARLADAVPGKIFEGRVQSIAWGIDPGRQVKGGLVANEANSRWFEPARRIPVRIELEGDMSEWPEQVRVGGKVHTVVFTGSRINPVALIARGFQRIRSWTSYLY